MGGVRPTENQRFVDVQADCYSSQFNVIYDAWDADVVAAMNGIVKRILGAILHRTSASRARHFVHSSRDVVTFTRAPYSYSIQ